MNKQTFQVTYTVEVTDLERAAILHHWGDGEHAHLPAEEQIKMFFQEYGCNEMIMSHALDEYRHEVCDD